MVLGVTFVTSGDRVINPHLSESTISHVSIDVECVLSDYLLIISLHGNFLQTISSMKERIKIVVAVLALLALAIAGGIAQALILRGDGFIPETDRGVYFSMVQGNSVAIALHKRTLSFFSAERDGKAFTLPKYYPEIMFGYLNSPYVLTDARCAEGKCTFVQETLVKTDECPEGCMQPSTRQVIFDGSDEILVNTLTPAGEVETFMRYRRAAPDEELALYMANIKRIGIAALPVLTFDATVNEIARFVR